MKQALPHSSFSLIGILLCQTLFYPWRVLVFREYFFSFRRPHTVLRVLLSCSLALEWIINWAKQKYNIYGMDYLQYEKSFGAAVFNVSELINGQPNTIVIEITRTSYLCILIQLFPILVSNLLSKSAQNYQRKQTL